MAGFEDQFDPAENLAGTSQSTCFWSGVEVQEIRRWDEDERVPSIDQLFDVLALDRDSATRPFGQGFVLSESRIQQASKKLLEICLIPKLALLTV